MVDILLACTDDVPDTEIDEFLEHYSGSSGTSESDVESTEDCELSETSTLSNQSETMVAADLKKQLEGALRERDEAQRRIDMMQKALGGGVVKLDANASV
ncbi:hypothetical protein K474DRAFT_1664633 [Panus rudis PR-1116 ss-1]|nr:hypothetical protein K474DRAFT_1664633 [Panus rudis PR-1116 ss-1]